MYSSALDDLKHFLKMHIDQIGKYFPVLLACAFIYRYGRATGKLDGIREANRR